MCQAAEPWPIWVVEAFNIKTRWLKMQEEMDQQQTSVTVPRERAMLVWSAIDL